VAAKAVEVRLLSGAPTFGFAPTLYGVGLPASAGFAVLIKQPRVLRSVARVPVRLIGTFPRPTVAPFLPGRNRSSPPYSMNDGPRSKNRQPSGLNRPGIADNIPPS
jgi:hypothetical protein